MKAIPIMLLCLSVPVLAGTSAKEVVAPAPAPAPCIFTWFAGGSVGYLTEFEEPMYHLHLGTDTCWNLGGWGVAFFAEIGYTEKDGSWSGRRNQNSFLEELINGNNGLFSDNFRGDLDDLENALSDIARNFPFFNTSYDLDIMPITLNVKLERPLTNNLNVYFGGGLGMALVDLSLNVGPMSFSDDDWVFVGQLFAGLNYNFNPNFEMYSGVRWIYFEDADFNDSGSKAKLELDDDFLFELGARFNF